MFKELTFEKLQKQIEDKELLMKIESLIVIAKLSNYSVGMYDVEINFSQSIRIEFIGENIVHVININKPKQKEITMWQFDEENGAEYYRTLEDLIKNF